MGIRFYCPNGHKLNVKKFQAGRKGICPFCGAKIQIPGRSTRPSSRGAAPPNEGDAVEGDVDEAMEAAMAEFMETGTKTGPAGANAGAAAGSKAGAAGAGRQVAPSQPPEGPPSGALSRSQAGQAASGPAVPPSAPPSVARPSVTEPGVAQPGVTQPSVAQRDGVQPGGSESGGTEPGGAAAAVVTLEPSRPGEGQVDRGAAAASGVSATATTPTAPSPPTIPDPIAEAPEMIWYVRPPTGGQFGPAAGQLMRTWLAEGRLSGDTLVWREGWRDWQQAGNVFPQLQRDSGSMQSMVDVPLELPLGFSPPEARSEHPYHPRARHRFDGNQFTLVAALVIAVAILVAVFLFVLFGR